VHVIFNSIVLSVQFYQLQTGQAPLQDRVDRHWLATNALFFYFAQCVAVQALAQASARNACQLWDDLRIYTTKNQRRANKCDRKYAKTTLSTRHSSQKYFSNQQLKYNVYPAGRLPAWLTTSPSSYFPACFLRRAMLRPNFPAPHRLTLMRILCATFPDHLISKLPGCWLQV